MKPILDFNSLEDRLGCLQTRKRVAVACPEDGHTEYALKRALGAGFADVVLVCSERCSPEFENLAKAYPEHVSVLIEDSPDDAARKAVAIVRDGNADVLMKGTINTDNLLRAVLDKEHGILEPGNVLTHVTAAHIPAYPKMLFFTDAAVIPRPDLKQFDAMLRHALTLCRRMGVDCPNVALIHCTEKTSEKFPHTLSYKELTDRAGRGEYGDVKVFGPMDVKTACDAESGKVKGIASPVVGNADILIFPNIESGNVFYKTITLFGGAETAGVLCGTTVPVVVSSRADSDVSKYYSLAVACLVG